MCKMASAQLSQTLPHFLGWEHVCICYLSFFFFFGVVSVLTFNREVWIVLSNQYAVSEKMCLCMADLIFTLSSCCELTLYTDEADVLLLFFSVYLSENDKLNLYSPGSSLLQTALQTMKQQSYTSSEINIIAYELVEWNWYSIFYLCVCFLLGNKLLPKLIVWWKLTFIGWQIMSDLNRKIKLQTSKLNVVIILDHWCGG